MSNPSTPSTRALHWIVLSILVLAACRGKVDSPPAGLPETLDSAAPVKINTATEGIYRLTSADLEPFGMTGVFEKPDAYRLTTRGAPQSFWIESHEGEPALVFYAAPSDSAYTADNIYILWSGEPPDAFAPSGQPHAAPTPAAESLGNLPADAYAAVSHREQNQLYLPQAEAQEHWYWLALPPGQTEGVEIFIDQLAAQAANGSSSNPALTARLRWGVYASTQAPEDPDHHLRVSVNGVLVADKTWDGRGYQVQDVDFASDLLNEGANQVSFEVPGDTGSIAELNQLDWVEIIYPRRLVANQDFLDFTSPGGELTLLGFSGAPSVYRLASSSGAVLLEGVISTPEGKGVSARLEVPSGERLIAVGPKGYLQPDHLAPLNLSPDFSQAAPGAEYLAVGPTDLIEPLQPLLDHRGAQGLKVQAVPVEAVYDQFNHGFPEPEAIQRFVQDASLKWQPAPKYLLLVGDATYDPLGYQAPPEANRLPTFLIDTVFGGQTASDVGFVQTNADPWPDLPVGRIPARTPTQVAVFVEKTLAYEKILQTAAQPPLVIAIADGQDASFALDAQAFLDQLKPSYTTQLYTPPAGDASASGRISQYLSGGNLMVAYFGHGSVTMWGKDKIFTAEDAASLQRGDQLSVVLNLTCLTGLFTHPGVESLAEALLFAPGGAVAVLAPSSLTLAADQSFLTRPFIQALLESPQATLGELHLAARRKVSTDQPGPRDVMMTFMLFGDPALRLH